MSKIIRYELDSEAISYIKEHLSLGKQLSKLLLGIHNFEKGKVVTFADESVDSISLRSLNTGGIILPHDHGQEITDSSGKQWRIVEKPNMNKELETLIGDYLHKDDDRVVVFEDALAHASDPNVPANLKYRTFDNDVYYLLESDDQCSESIGETLKEAQSWLFICVLTSSVRFKRGGLENRHLSKDDLRQFAERAIAIVIGAYDGEGFIIWEKSPVATQFGKPG